MKEREAQFLDLIESIEACTLEAIEDMNHNQGNSLNQILIKREEPIKALGALLETCAKLKGSNGYKTEREMLIRKNERVLKEINDLDLFMTNLASTQMEAIKTELKSIKAERIIQNYSQDTKAIRNKLDLVQ